MLFQLRLNCSARSHRLRWSPGDSTDLHNDTQLEYIVYDLEKRDFRQFLGPSVTLLGRCDLAEEIGVRECSRGVRGIRGLELRFSARELSAQGSKPNPKFNIRDLIFAGVDIVYRYDSHGERCFAWSFRRSLGIEPHLYYPCRH